MCFIYNQSKLRFSTKNMEIRGYFFASNGINT